MDQFVRFQHFPFPKRQELDLPEIAVSSQIEFKLALVEMDFE